MNSPEPIPTLRQLIGDTDTDELLEYGLTPSGYPSGNTDIFFLNGYPDIVVRTNNTPANYITMAEAEETAAAVHRLTQFGVLTIPYLPVAHNGLIYVITQKVQGTGLEQVLTPQAPESVVRQVDRTWAGLSDYLRTGMLESRPVVLDIYGAHQHMYGTTSTGLAPDIRLVDLGEVSITLSVRQHIYAEQVMAMASYTVNNEIAVNSNLPLAQKALQAAMNVPFYRDEESDFYIEKARTILADHETVDVYVDPGYLFNDDI